MSGVGITGLIKPLNSGAFPVWEDIDGLGGFRTVVDITARNAIYANERKLGMQVKTQSDGNVWTLVGGLLDANWVLEQGQAPFKATFYVNPAFVGISTGSQSNPFVTIAAAFAYAASLALIGAVIIIPPSVTVTENVVFPSSGGQWEIASDVGFAGSATGSRITGTVTCNATTGSLFAKLRNIIVTGNTTGVASSGFILLLEETCVRQNGSITLTNSSGAGTCLGLFRGIGGPTANKIGGSNTLLVSVEGIVIANNWVFEGGVNEGPKASTTPYPGSQFVACWFGSTSGSPIPIGLNGLTLNVAFYDCIFVGPTTFTASLSNYVIYIDGSSLASLNHPVAGTILVGTGIQLKTINANASVRLTAASNIGSTAFGSRNPDGLYEVSFDQTLLVAGSVGTGQINVTYTDVTGTLVTATVGGVLNIASAVGTKAEGSLRFRHNGATAIAYSYTGIVTPGSLSVALSIALTCKT